VQDCENAQTVSEKLQLTTIIATTIGVLMLLWLIVFVRLWFMERKKYQTYVQSNVTSTVDPNTPRTVVNIAQFGDSDTAAGEIAAVQVEMEEKQQQPLAQCRL
jgi:hypothetical protein